MANMGVISTGILPKDLVPFFGEWFGEEFKMHEKIYERIFKRKVTSKGAYYESVQAAGTGFAPIKPEGAEISFGQISQMGIKAWRSVNYGKGFAITREMMEDGVALARGETFSRCLAQAINGTYEAVHANLHNNAFNSAYVGPDGVQLCATSHPLMSGGVQSNKLANDASLSVTALEQMVINILSLVSNDGVPMNVMPKELYIPPALVHTATKILKSNGVPFNANNDINSIRVNGYVADLVVNPYLSSSTAYFLITDVADGLATFEKAAPKLEEDNEFTTQNLRMALTARFIPIWSDYRCTYGSQGLT